MFSFCNKLVNCNITVCVCVCVNGYYYICICTLFMYIHTTLQTVLFYCITTLNSFARTVADSVCLQFAFFPNPGATTMLLFFKVIHTCKARWTAKQPTHPPPPPAIHHTPPNGSGLEVHFSSVLLSLFGWESDTSDPNWLSRLTQTISKPFSQ